MSIELTFDGTKEQAQGYIARSVADRDLATALTKALLTKTPGNQVSLEVTLTSDPSNRFGKLEAKCSYWHR